MEGGSLAGGEDGEYNGIGLVEISHISARQDVFVFGAESFGAVL